MKWFAHRDTDTLGHDEKGIKIFPLYNMLSGDDTDSRALSGGTFRMSRQFPVFSKDKDFLGVVGQVIGYNNGYSELKTQTSSLETLAKAQSQG